jgi:hypothetical protein
VQKTRQIKIVGAPLLIPSEADFKHDETPAVRKRGSEL